jgi:hypothetical protein
MAIYKLLRETAFDADTAEAMGQAYEALLLDLGLKDRHDPFTEIIAKEIIQVASCGVHDAPAIRASVLAALEKSGPADTGT